jgi:type III secretion protein C
MRWVLCLLVLLVALPGLSMAQGIPWRQQRFDFQASNEPLNAFLGRMLTLNGIAATMSPPIASAKVNGRLQGSAETVFRELSDTYGLTWYYDGSMLYVYSLSEMESRMLQVSPVDVPRVERTLKEMHLLDPRFPLKTSSSEGQVLVSGPPKYVQLVSDIAARVAGAPSQSAQQVDTRVFRLRNARAADTVVSIAGTETTIPGVARILDETFGSSRGSQAMGPPSRSLPVTLPGLRGKGQAAVGRKDGSGSAEPRIATAPSADSTAANATSASAITSSNELAVPLPALGATRLAASSPNSQDRSSRTEAVNATGVGPIPFSDAVVRADPRINAVIIRDTQDRMPMYARLIAELDVVMPLLEIEATVIDVSHDKSDQLGIDWRLHGQRADVVSSPNGLAGTGQGRPTNNANDLLYSIPARSAGTGLVGTLLFGSDRTHFLARLNALTQTGDAKLISKPRVLTINNTEAVLQSTQDFYVRVAGRDQVDLFNVSLGLTLRVTPTVIEDPEGARVKLNIRIEDGNTNSGNQVDQIPVVNRNAISTQAVVGDGHSLLIGGYTTEEEVRTRSGVPVLSEMPGLRWLFGQKGTTTKRMERVFMITPRLVKPEDVDAKSSSLAPASGPAAQSVEVLQ